MSGTKLSKYLKKWRKAHPRYHRDYMRRSRADVRTGATHLPKRKTITILGVLVNLPAKTESGGGMSEAYKNRMRHDFFKRRVTVIGLARKYSCKVAKVEEVLRWRK
jgi:hypothetical protein